GRSSGASAHVGRWEVPPFLAPRRVGSSKAVRLRRGRSVRSRALLVDGESVPWVGRVLGSGRRTSNRTRPGVWSPIHAWPGTFPGVVGPRRPGGGRAVPFP